MFWILLCFVIPDVSSMEPNTTFELSDQEVFVGETAILEWKINQNILPRINMIKFGLATELGVHEERLEAIFVKLFPTGEIKWNTGKDQRIASFRSRTKVLENTTAGFSLTNVKLNDSSQMYCTVRFIGTRHTMTDYVILRVVDIQILNETSSQDVLSWKNHKVRLKCHAKVSRDTPTSFVWRNKAKENAISRFLHKDTRIRSILTVVTYDDEDFGPYICVARTSNTNQTHEIRIKRLYEPSAPDNITRKRVLKQFQFNCSVLTTVTWMPPLQNGGAPVTHYVIEYKPIGQGWRRAKRRRVNTTSMNICRPPRDQGGNGLEVRVMAKNKVGIGEPSGVSIVTFWGEPTAPRNLVCRLMRNPGDPYIRLSWDYPHDDGGVSVTGYRVEYKPVRTSWRNAMKKVTSAKEVKLWKKANDDIYQLRVRAFNGVGVSDASEILKVAYVEKPTRPLNIAIAATAHDTAQTPHIHIRWERPLDDGGSRILSYLLEYKEEGQRNWTQAKYAEIIDNEYVLRGIDRNLKYDVRVFARNSMGYGPPSRVVSVKYTEEVYALPRSRGSGRVTDSSMGLVLVLLLVAISTTKQAL